MVRSLSVVTVAFGSGCKINEWAGSWQAAGAECIICDNGGSVPGDLPAGASVLPFKGNAGFGGGINRAVEAADTPLVLITNPDTLPVSNNSLDAFIGKHQKNSFSGGSTTNRAGQTVHSTGVWPDMSWVKRQVFLPAGSLWRPDRVDWLQGSLILAYRDDFLKLGGFSEAYPLYFEDVDICARADKAGMGIKFEPGFRFVHDEGTGSSGSSSLRLASFHWGLVEFFRNHKPDEYDKIRRLVLLKCILRTFALAPFKPKSAAGYLSGFRAILRRTPPLLPGRANG